MVFYNQKSVRPLSKSKYMVMDWILFWDIRCVYCVFFLSPGKVLEVVKQDKEILCIQSV